MGYRSSTQVKRSRAGLAPSIFIFTMANMKVLLLLATIFLCGMSTLVQCEETSSLPAKQDEPVDDQLDETVADEEEDEDESEDEDETEDDEDEEQQDSTQLSDPKKASVAPPPKKDNCAVVWRVKWCNGDTSTYAFTLTDFLLRKVDVLDCSWTGCKEVRSTMVHLSSNGKYPQRMGWFQALSIHSKTGAIHMRKEGTGMKFYWVGVRSIPGTGTLISSPNHKVAAKPAPKKKAAPKKKKAHKKKKAAHKKKSKKVVQVVKVKVSKVSSKKHKKH